MGLPWGLVIKISPSNAGGEGSISGPGAKIPHAMGAKKTKHKKNGSNSVTNSTQILKMVHIKKKKNYRELTVYLI